MFTEYRKIHIVVIAKLGINIYIYTYRQLCWERGNIHCVRPLGRMHTILVLHVITILMQDSTGSLIVCHKYLSVNEHSCLKQD